jgi:hypothetical protein
MRARVAHTEDCGDRWHIQVQVSRATRIYEAMIPKDGGPLELDVFLGQVRDTITRKLKDPQS